MIKKMLRKMLERLLRRYGYTIAPLDGAPDPLSPKALRLRLFRQLGHQGFRPTHILDVGAHTGDWSWDAREVFPNCAFTLIEPQKEMEPSLVRFCAGQPKARYLLAGAGAVEGELPFTVARRTDSSSFLISKETAREEGLERRQVRVVTLDGVCAEPGWPLPEIVKIDAEGFELEILAGARTLLGRTDLLFLEVPLIDLSGHPSLHDIFGALHGHGYEPYDFTDLNRYQDGETLALLEVAFVRRGSILRP